MWLCTEAGTETNEALMRLLLVTVDNIAMYLQQEIYKKTVVVQKQKEEAN